MIPIEGIFRIEAFPLNSGFNNSAQVEIGLLIKSGLIPNVSALYTVGIKVTYLEGSEVNSLDLGPFRYKTFLGAVP